MTRARSLSATVAPAVLASGLVALVLPFSAPSAHAEGRPAFAGYNDAAWAAPVRIELYEPTIPIPANPQLEIDLAYSTVEAETGLARGRASWLWPGDPVGEGAKTFVEQLGLPPQLGENGYPVQVNSAWPAGPDEQADEPLPGTVMRTRSDDSGASAAAGFSPDGDTSDPQGGDSGGSDGGGLPGVPGLPGPPDAPDDPLPGLDEFGAAITGGRTMPAPTSPTAPGVPPELAALVDFAGYLSTSTATTTASQVTTSSRSALTEVSLLGGLITVESVSTRIATASDGDTGRARGSSRVVGLEVAGNAFRIGADGVEVAGQPAPVPGLPDDPARALAALGVEVSAPRVHAVRRGDAGRGLAQGLRLDIDTRVLRSRLGDLPLQDLIDLVPSEAGELKSLLTAAAGLSPRIVVTLGNAGAATDTVQGLALPEVPTDPLGVDGPGATGGGAEGGLDGGAGGAAGAAGAAPGAPADSGPAADGDLPDAEQVAAGLPPLASIPGVLLVGGVALAAAAGTWLRKIGGLALGGAATCSHGLDSGLPDLRKA